MITSLLIGLSVNRDGAECGPFDLHGLILVPGLKTRRSHRSLKCHRCRQDALFPSVTDPGRLHVCRIPGYRIGNGQSAGIKALRGAGYKLVMHAHDEVCAEMAIGQGSGGEFERLLVEAPAWAQELPIAAKVFECNRFSLATAGAAGGGRRCSRCSHSRLHLEKAKNL